MPISLPYFVKIHSIHSLYAMDIFFFACVITKPIAELGKIWILFLTVHFCPHYSDHITSVWVCFPYPDNHLDTGHVTSMCSVKAFRATPLYPHYSLRTPALFFLRRTDFMFCPEVKHYISPILTEACVYRFISHSELFRPLCLSYKYCGTASCTGLIGEKSCLLS